MRRKWTQTRWLILTVSLAFWISSTAFAYQFGSVTQDTDLKKEASATSDTLAKLPKGSVVTASDQATDGFYKVRTTTGAVGFAAASVLTLRPAAGAKATQAQTQAQNQVKRTASASHQSKIFVKFFYGVDMWTLPDLDPDFGSGNLSGGSALGGEFGYNLSPRLAVALRIEHLAKEVQGPDASTGNTYDVTISATPIMVGVEYNLIPASSFNLILGGFLGPSSPSLNSTATNFSSNNVTTLSGSAFTFLFKLEADLALSHTFGLMVEGGYRLMKTGTITPTPSSANGSDNFDQGGTSPVPVPLNLSGTLLTFGLKVSF
jgi:hypothetical protein